MGTASYRTLPMLMMPLEVTIKASVTQHRALQVLLQCNVNVCVSRLQAKVAREGGCT